MPNPTSFRVTKLRTQTYARRVLETRHSNLIGYWPLSEAEGTIAYDLSGRGNNGTYTGVDLARQGIGDGQTCPYFDGTNDYVNIYSAALAAAFNPNAGTVVGWGRVPSGAWVDGSGRDLLRFRADGNNYIRLYKSDVANVLSYLYKAGGTETAYYYSNVRRLDFFCMAMTWSYVDNRVVFYLNGFSVALSAGLGIWAGAVGTFLIGAGFTTPTYLWLGNLAHCALWNCALSSQEVARIGTVD